jgi:hypothetical protein
MGTEISCQYSFEQSLKYPHCPSAVPSGGCLHGWPLSLLDYWAPQWAFHFHMWPTYMTGAFPCQCLLAHMTCWPCLNISFHSTPRVDETLMKNVSRRIHSQLLADRRPAEWTPCRWSEDTGIIFPERTCCLSHAVLRERERVLTWKCPHQQEMSHSRAAASFTSKVLKKKDQKLFLQDLSSQSVNFRAPLMTLKSHEESFPSLSSGQAFIEPLRNVLLSNPWARQACDWPTFVCGSVLSMCVYGGGDGIIVDPVYSHKATQWDGWPAPWSVCLTMSSVFTDTAELRAQALWIQFIKVLLSWLSTDVRGSVSLNWADGSWGACVMPFHTSVPQSNKWHSLALARAPEQWRRMGEVATARENLDVTRWED